MNCWTCSPRWTAADREGIQQHGHTEHRVQHWLLLQFRHIHNRHPSQTRLHLPPIPYFAACTPHPSPLPLQVINYKCLDPRTQELLNEDIKLTVTKQNELNAKEQDSMIRETENEIKKRQADLDMQMM
jgi:hypothetical protein